MNVGKVVDRIAGQLAQPVQLAPVVVARDAQARGEFAEDVDVVAAFVHRLDRLPHEDRVVPGARPRRVNVVPLPERRGRQHDVGIGARSAS